MGEILPQIANPIFATWSFIICMFTLCIQAIAVTRKLEKTIKIVISLTNAITWLITAIACIAMLYTGWSKHILEPLYCFMYIVRVFASFCISATSVDLASKELVKE